ncbi:MAG: O-antigen ligase family protein [Actinobacteria bacterium]|nr:O-antigen ligase family protein [Actinomycetota bacterium]
MNLSARSVSLWVDETESRPPLTALWRQLALISLTFAIVDGFGAYSQLLPLTPMKYVVVQLALLIATLIVCPPGSLAKVFLPIPSLLLVGWWVLSYMWDNNRAGWISVSSRDLTVIVTVVLLAQVLGEADFVRCLLRSGYISIGLIFVALAVQPGLAYSVAGPAPGLHGGFIHKNTMAPCLLLTAAVVVCMHPSRAVRRWLVAFVAVLLFLGQTTTGLATLAALLLVNGVLGSYKRVVRRLGRAAGSLLIGAALLATLVAATTFSSLVLLSGKDLTFSSRTVIWEGVTDAISGRFWLGYGYGVWENLWVEPIRSINLNNGFIVAHAHNAALDLMLRLGAVGLGLYVIQLLNAARAGWRGLIGDDPFGRLVLLYCTMIVLVGFSESLPAFGLWLGLLIAFATLKRR